jgi:hypothetical protein
MTNWLSLPDAAKHFGYENSLGLRRRIQQLRKRGKVEDIGAVPEKYLGEDNGPVKIYWPDWRTMQIASDAPRALMAAKKKAKPKAIKKKSR